MRLVLDRIQHQSSQIIAEALLGERPPEEDFATADDPGLFGPDSVTWRIHADTATLIGGFRSLLLQTLHPLAMAAVHDHSVIQDDPLGRFRRTSKFVLTTTLGNSVAAKRDIAIVNKIHSKISGHAPDGRPYKANDPHLILWVHVAEVDSFLDAYNRYGKDTLTEAEQDQYVREMSQIAIALGAERSAVPTTVADLTATLASFEAECVYGNHARDGVKFLLEAPMVPLARGPYAIYGAAALASLPQWAQTMMQIDPKPGVEPLLVEPVADVATQIMRWLSTDPYVERPVG